MSNLPTEGGADERYTIIVGGDGYSTATVTGRAAMERAFVRSHWDNVDFINLTDEQRETLALVRDEDRWEIDPRIGRTALYVAYECDWVRVFRLTDDLPGSSPEPAARPRCANCGGFVKIEQGGICMPCVGEGAISHDWQPIETAPRDGGHILVTIGNMQGFGSWPKPQDMVTVAHWFEDGFYVSVFGGDERTAIQYTHWMPLPPSPTKEGDL